MSTTTDRERSRRFESQRERLRAQYLLPADRRPASTARGLHHTALLSSDVETTIRFYQDLLGFPLTELIENRDYPARPTSSSTSATATCSRSSTSPGLDVGPYREVLGGLHHIAISVAPDRWDRLRSALGDAGGVAVEEHSGVSLYFRDPDGARVELIADPLGEMYGHHVL